MLGALILQVMNKSEIEALKVMIYLIESVLPTGYFCGSLGGLQADMAVFNEILSTRLPKLSTHLQRLQGHIGEGKRQSVTAEYLLASLRPVFPINVFFFVRTA